MTRPEPDAPAVELDRHDIAWQSWGGPDAVRWFSTRTSTGLSWRTLQELHGPTRPMRTDEEEAAAA